MNLFLACKCWLHFMMPFFTVLATASTLFAGPSSRPNIVFILADDMGFSDAGCYGSEIETPNLDRLAAGGLRFSRCYNSAWCAPSRLSLLTGYYPTQAARMTDKQGPLQPSWIRVLPHYLKPYGYRCYHSGKWHLPLSKPLTSAGFARSYYLEDQDRFFSPSAHALDEKRLQRPAREEGYYATSAITDYAIHFLRDHAESSKVNGSPFLLYLAYTSPHFPLHALQKDIAKYEGWYRDGWDVIRERRWQRLKEQGLVNCDLAVRPTRVPPPVVLQWKTKTSEVSDPVSVLGEGETALAPAWTELSEKQKKFQATKMAIHAAMVTRMDIEIGRVLDQLRTMGAMQDTIIFFASDNGACATIMVRGDGHDPDAPAGSADSYLCVGPGWASASNSPLRLFKVWTYEGGISTPFIVHWPAGIRKRGEIRHTPVHFIDIVPTMIELAGGKQSDSRRNDTGPPLPGRSIVPCFDGDADLQRDPLFLDQPNDWRWAWPEEDRRRFQKGFRGFRALITSRHKLVQSQGSTTGWELYDMITDRCEKNDLAGQLPDKVKQLADIWNKSSKQFQQDTLIP